jgi:tetratricopeptide (TPR) repeat protein
MLEIKMARSFLSPLSFALPLALALSLPVHPTLIAQASAEAKELSPQEAEYEKGLTFFKGGDYERAVLAFMNVYRIAPNPNLVYNIARCFEELKRFNEAADYYEEYLKLKPQAEDRAQISLTIKTLRTLGKDQQAKSAKDTTSSGANTRSILAWSAVGVGGALALGGLWSGAQASDAASRRDGASDAASYKSAQDEMSRASSRADLLYIGGAALLTTGAVLLLTGGDEEAQAGLSISASHRHVSLSWTF